MGAFFGGEEADEAAGAAALPAGECGEGAARVGDDAADAFGEAGDAALAAGDFAFEIEVVVAVVGEACGAEEGAVGREIGALVEAEGDEGGVALAVAREEEVEVRRVGMLVLKNDGPGHRGKRSSGRARFRQLQK